MDHVTMFMGDFVELRKTPHHNADPRAEIVSLYENGDIGVTLSNGTFRRVTKNAVTDYFPATDISG